MRGFVANTDHGWYEFLRRRGSLEEVNFWQPGTRAFRALEPGEPLFFRLKAPVKAIGGFGLFLRWTLLPIWLAWDAFGQANGATTRQAMVERVASLRRAPDPTDTAMIGCIVLLAPAFFAPEDWVVTRAHTAQSCTGNSQRRRCQPTSRLIVKSRLDITATRPTCHRYLCSSV